MRRAWVLGALLLDGCALLSKGEVSSRRFFSLELPATASQSAPVDGGIELRLGRITAGACSSELIMVRRSTFEVVFDEERRWTEPPEVFLRRSLGRALFDGSALRSVVRGKAPVLEVELLQFEEVLTPTHVGRVGVSFTLSDERVVTAQRSFTIERPVQGTGDDAVANAIREALEAVVERIASETRAALGVSP